MIGARHSVFALIAGMAAAQGAFAHAKLVAAIPAAGGVARARVGMLELGFSYAVSARGSGVVGKPAGGGTIAGRLTVGKAGRSLALTPEAPLGPGTYAVDWHAVASDDGHRTGGSYSFVVR